jgi:hypothetical protein
MEITKQTAVDFLMDKLFDPSMMVDEQLKWFEQAKEMEKKQMIEFARKILMEAYATFSGNVTTELEIEEYYEQTYGGNN